MTTMRKFRKSKIVPASNEGRALMTFLFVLMLSMSYAAAEIMSSIESKIDGIIVALIGLGVMMYGKGSTDDPTDWAAIAVGAVITIVGVGMIGGDSFYNSLRSFWNFLR